MEWKNLYDSMGCHVSSILFHLKSLDTINVTRETYDRMLV